MMYFLIIRRPPISTRTDTHFPYTTLFRSGENPSGKSLDRNIPDDRFGLSAFRKSEPGSGSDRSRLFYDQMVFPGLSGGHPDRLLVFAETNRAAGDRKSTRLNSRN